MIVHEVILVSKRFLLSVTVSIVNRADTFHDLRNYCFMRKILKIIINLSGECDAI
jgi:hypothetical protein